MSKRVRPGACKRCLAPLARDARRCSSCGAQVFVTVRSDPQVTASKERERLLRKYALSEIQQQILTAAMAAGDEIFVVGKGKLEEGEVKSGDQRFYGDEAVMAVAALAGPGLISSQGEDCFRLTPDGTRVAKTLQTEPV